MISIRTKRGKSAASIAVGLGAIVVAGCNLLVSAGDYHVVAEGPEDATTSGDAAGPETSTSDASDSGPGSSDANDAAAPDGDAALPSEDSGPPCGSTLQVSSTAFQQLVRACVLDTACDYGNYNSGNGEYIGDCIAENSLETFGATACELTAQTCADIEACTGEGFASECDGGATTAFCDKTNNLAENCTGSSGNFGPGYLYDCTKYGGTCESYDAGDDAGGLTAACKVVSTCTGDPSTYQCSGNDLFQCVGGVGYGVNCHVFESSCDDGGAGTGETCIYSAASCPAGGASPCNQAVGQYCFPDSNQLGQFNCGAGGLTCVPIQNPASGDLPFECLAPGCTDDDVNNCVSSCTGTVATFCVGGAAVTFDCASLSMGCDDSNNWAQCYPLTF